MIPNCVHQVWLQGGEVPSPLSDNAQEIVSICARAKWEYKLWDASDIGKLPDSGKDFTRLSSNCGSIVQQSNLARFFILREIGGLYLDLDVQLRSLPPLFGGAWVPGSRAMHRIGSFALACSPHHPWIERLVSMLANVDLKIRGSAGSKLIAASLGPDVHVWPRELWEESGKNEETILGTHSWSGNSLGHFNRPPVLSLR
jgi:mannosyltransferase OCH1-like enzyme